MKLWGNKSNQSLAVVEAERHWQESANTQENKCSLGGWLRSGNGNTRKADFEYATYTHGAIQCSLFELSATHMRLAKGAGNHEGDAFVVALRLLNEQAWEPRK